MPTIGERTAKAIRDRVKKNNSLLKDELRKIDVSRRALLSWELYGMNPSAYFLQQMALEGYDIMWILTGEESNG